MHRHQLAKLATISIQEMGDTEFHFILAAYSYSSFSTSEIFNMIGRPRRQIVVNSLKKSHYIKLLRKKQQTRIYTLTDKAKAVIDRYYQWLLGEEDIPEYL